MLTKLLAILIHCELRKEDYKTWIQVLEDQPYLALSKKKKKKERKGLLRSDRHSFENKGRGESKKSMHF